MPPIPSQLPRINSPAPLPRRDFLRTTAAAGLALGLGSPGAARAGQPQPPVALPRARHVIILIADGMSIDTLTLADSYLRLHHDRPSQWVRLWSRPGVRRSMAFTDAADALVTDSAAAATAISIGQRVNNGAICTTPDGADPAPILVRAKERGIATGLVTTTRITHATPAAFIANTPSRNQERQIAAQILDRGVDIALGGGEGRFDAGQLASLRSTRILRTRDDLLALAPARAGASQPDCILGLFADSHMAYEIDRPALQPSLTEMTRAALAWLAAHPDAKSGGFLVQIEGGRIDHGAHANDAASLIRDQIAFDEALGIAVEFTVGRDDTLLIVTTDHGNANPGLTVYGPEGERRFRRIADAKHSFEWLSAQLSEHRTPEAQIRALPGLVEQASGIQLDAAELGLLARVARGERTHPLAISNSLKPVLGGILAGHFGVAFLSPNHTSDLVEVTALGPGSEGLPPVIHLTDLHTLIAGVLSLTAP